MKKTNLNSKKTNCPYCNSKTVPPYVLNPFSVRILKKQIYTFPLDYCCNKCEKELNISVEQILKEDYEHKYHENPLKTLTECSKCANWAIAEYDSGYQEYLN